jgi:hypothetical protein
MKLKPLALQKRKVKNEWTDDQLAKLKKHFSTIDDPKNLVKKIGKTYVAITSKAGVLGLKRLRKANDPWTEFRLDKIKKWYPDTENKIIAERLGLRVTQVDAKGFKLGLKKTKEFMYMQAMRTSFKKGQMPANKGKKQTEYMSAEAIERTKATRFKKGGISRNTLHDGIITIRHSSAKRGRKPYKMIRISKGKWQELQKYNWQKVNGIIPKGMCLWCKNGDTLNCDPSNWEVITRAENVMRNSGSIHLKDGVVAVYILGKENATTEAIAALKANPKLIEAKRLQLQLNRAINANKSRKNK